MVFTISVTSRRCGLSGLKRFSKSVSVAADDHEQVIKIVGHASGQAADGFHLLRFEQRFLGQLAPRNLSF